MFGDVAPRADGTLIVSGSHRLVHKCFSDNPPPGANGVPAIANCFRGIRIFVTSTLKAMQAHF